MTPQEIAQALQAVKIGRNPDPVLAGADPLQQALAAARGLGRKGPIPLPASVYQPRPTRKPVRPAAPVARPVPAAPPVPPPAEDPLPYDGADLQAPPPAPAPANPVPPGAQAAATAARATGQAEADLGQAKAEIAEDAVRTAEDQQVATQQALDTEDEDRARAHYREAMDKFETAGLKDYWADKSTGQKIGAFFLIGLGAKADEVIARDRQMQLDRIAKLKDNVTMAATGLKDAGEARSRMIQDTELREAAAYKVLRAREVAKLTGKGWQPEQAKNNERVLQIEQKGIEAVQRAEQERERYNEEKWQARERLRIQEIAARKPSGGVNIGIGGRGTVYDPQTGAPIGTVPNDKTGKASGEIKKALENHANMKALATKLLESYEREGVTMPGTDAAQDRESTATTLKLLAKNQYELGALSGPDMSLIEGIAGGFLTNTMGQAGPKVRNLLAQMDAGIERKMNAQGVVRTKPPKVKGGTYDPATGNYGGKPAPAAAPAGKRVRLKSGETGTLSPDGTFTPDN